MKFNKDKVMNLFVVFDNYHNGSINTKIGTQKTKKNVLG